MPAAFLRDIICQESALDRLHRAYASDRLANTWIFAGPEGVGKYTAAAAWARLLLCQKPVRQDTSVGPRREACGRCESCLLMNGEAHPDFTHVYKELVEYTRQGSRKQPPSLLPIDVIREFLLERVASSPRVSSCKVFVVSEAEKLTAQAQNAMLKALEEPPADCYIILLCTRMERLLPTTLSRCQIARFGAIDESSIVGALSERGVEEDEARYWARHTAGSLGGAIRWAGLRPGDTSAYKFKRKLVSSLASLRLVDALDAAESIAAGVKLLAEERQRQVSGTSRTDITRMTERGVVYMISAALSDAMKVAGGLEGQLVNADQPREIAALASRLGTERSAELVAATYRSVGWAEANVNARLVFEDLLLNICGCDII